MSDTAIKNPLVAAQLLSLKNYVASLRLAGQQCQLGVQGKAAFAALDAVVEEVEAVCAETEPDVSLITAGTIDQETMMKVGAGGMEERIEQLDRSAKQAAEALNSAARDRFMHLRETCDPSRSEDSNQADADQIAGMSQGAVADGLGDMSEFFVKMVEVTVGYVMSARLEKIAEALKSKQS